MSGIPLSNRHNGVYVSSPFYSLMEIPSFHNDEFKFLEHKMTDKVQISVALIVIYKCQNAINKITLLFTYIILRENSNVWKKRAHT
jgi:hypothetical protein